MIFSDISVKEILKIHLNSNRHQSIGGFVEQHQWSHHVLLLPIDGVRFQPIQNLVVTQENVAFLFEIREQSLLLHLRQMKREVLQVTNSRKECVVAFLSSFDVFKLYRHFITRRVTHPHFPAQAAPSAEEHHVVSNGEVAGQSCTAPDYSGIDSVQTLVAKKRIVPPVFLHIVWKEGRCVSTCSYITLCGRSG